MWTWGTQLDLVAVSVVVSHPLLGNFNAFENVDVGRSSVESLVSIFICALLHKQHHRAPELPRLI